MSLKTRQIVWTKIAKQSLDSYHNHISLTSPSNADKLKREILKTTRLLSKSPYIFQKDEALPFNDGSIRRFFRGNLRVQYEVTETLIIILDIHNTRSYPNF